MLDGSVYDFSEKNTAGLITKEKLTAAIIGKYNNYINSKKSYHEWLNEWIADRGGTEEFRIPEDIMLDFFRNRQN